MKIHRLRCMATACIMAIMSSGAQAGETGFASESGADMSVNDPAAQPMASCVAPCADDDSLDNCTQMERVVHVTALGIAGGVTLKVVGSAARNAVAFGKVKDIPIYGKAITHLPVCGEKLPIYGKFIGAVPLIGKAAGAATVPTTLGQVPFLGSAVKSVPILGPSIAGPANPIIVGAVAVDSYIIPKCQPCGYTERSEWAATDFNSPPTLRSYVNYVAPLPYTHPPIYAPSTLNTGRTPNTAMLSDLADASAVNIPH
ncbi:MAG: hypothetical protein ACR2IE_16210 [Candidatus Sumerlaeaceae bacterium]